MFGDSAANCKHPSVRMAACLHLISILFKKEKNRKLNRRRLIAFHRRTQAARAKSTARKRSMSGGGGGLQIYVQLNHKRRSRGFLMSLRGNSGTR